MRTLQQELATKLNARPMPIIKVKKESFNLSLREVIMKQPPVGKLEESENWTETLREPENPENMWNGGDYWMGGEYIDRFSFDRTSCDIGGNDDYVGGYYRGRPLIALVSSTWATEFPDNFGVQVKFPDGSYYNCGHKEWGQIAKSVFWREIGSSSEGATFRKEEKA